MLPSLIGGGRKRANSDPTFGGKGLLRGEEATTVERLVMKLATGGTASDAEIDSVPCEALVNGLCKVLDRDFARLEDRTRNGEYVPLYQMPLMAAARRILGRYDDMVSHERPWTEDEVEGVRELLNAVAVVVYEMWRQQSFNGSESPKQEPPKYFS